MAVTWEAEAMEEEEVVVAQEVDMGADQVLVEEVEALEEGRICMAAAVLCRAIMASRG